MTREGSLPYLVDEIKRVSGRSDVESDLLWYAIRGAIRPELLVSNIAEVLRRSADETQEYLVKCGFGDLVAQGAISTADKPDGSEKSHDYFIPSAEDATLSPIIGDIFSLEFFPGLSQPIRLPESRHRAVSLAADSLVRSMRQDVFLDLYRRGVAEYYRDFMSSDAKAIDEYIADSFGNGYPRYIVNSGIGANEQFNHLVAHLNNINPDRRSNWLIVDSPRHLVKLPSDAGTDNTLFMEFSRSGKTEETVKIHEYTSRSARRIVFANSGPLRDIGARDGNLLLTIPDQVPGRFGRNKTPILLAPMHTAGMDTGRFWQTTQKTIEAFDLSAPGNIPMQLALFIYVHQIKNGINHVYLGCNDDSLAFSADEFLQFWNEGVNKNANDISMSRYFGLLRDSHFTIEGILANHRTKLGLFLLRDTMKPEALPPMTSATIDPINENHRGLSFGDEELILAEANVLRFSELMPSIRILVHGELTIDHAAVLGQLWSDITFCYSRIANVDPGSNPEVKHVRDRSARLLEEAAVRARGSAGRTA